MLALREGPTRPANATLTTPLDETTEHPRVLACAGCGAPITSSAERIAIAGAHEHFEVNPQGYSFRIGCFASARNVVTMGPPDPFWTWFPGYSWQIEACVRCDAHLGWLFTDTADRFHGLILDQLVEVDAAHG